MTQVLSWSRSQLAYQMNGRSMPQSVIKAAADSVSNEARATIRVLSDRLQSGVLSLDEWYGGMQEATKLLHASETALARGGWDNMRPSDWERASGKVLEQWEGVEGKFPGLRSFAEDIEKGRYGQNAEMTGLNQRAQMYSDAGHASYENERTFLHEENGFATATRIRGDADSCPTCLEEDGVDRPINEVVEIGNSECGSKCRCVIIYSRD